MSFSNNINPGNPPLNWQKVKEAFDVINQNFTQVGAAIAQYREVTIINIDQSNPVKITTDGDHLLTDGTRIVIKTTGVSQLDGNEYYVKSDSVDEVLLYTDEALTTAVDGSAHDGYPSSGGTLQGFSPFANLDFDVFRNNIIPAETGRFDLGSATKQWREVHIEPGSEVPGAENNGLWLGTALIRGQGNTITLPFGSTIFTEDEDADPVPILDPNKTFFKEVQVDNDQVVVASSFVDSLNLLSGTAIQMTVDSSAESITIANTGVTQLTGSTGISVSASTGNITLSNTGVTSIGNGSTLPSGLPVGSGISRDNTTGVVTFTNTGVIDLDDGFGITLSRDDATGIVTVTNSAPAVNTFGTFAVSGQADVSPDNTADTLEFIQGYGIVITTDGINDRITFTLDQNIDINGSVFADDSTLLVDAVMGRIVADVYADVYGNVTGNLTGNVTGNSTGYHTGDVKGSVFGDDSSLIVDAVDNKIYADEIITPQIIATTSFGLSTGGLTSISTNDNIELNATSGAIYANTTLFDITGPLTVSGTVSGNVTGNLTGYQTGDMTGSVFADDSTKLVDAVAGKIVGPIESESIKGNLVGSVFADDSTMIVNGMDGSLYYEPTTPGDWDGDAPTSVGEALDRLATLIKTLNGGTGA